MGAWFRRPSDSANPAVVATDQSAAISGDNINSPIRINSPGLDEKDVLQGVRRIVLGELLPELAKAKGVPEAPLQAVLLRLGEKQVPAEEIPARLTAAADELIRLREELTRFRSERPELATFRTRALAHINQGEFDAARAVLQQGRLAARALREEFSRTEAEFLADEARVERLQLNYDAACENFAEATGLDPGNCWIWIELGDLWVLRGSLAEAEKAFRAALKAAGGTNQRDLSVSYDKVGNVLVAQGNLPEALKSYRDSLTIADRLAQADPGNAGWQRDLALSHGRVALVQSKVGARDDALDAFRRGRNIIEHLVRQSPDHATLPKDLAWFDSSIHSLTIDSDKSN